MNSVSTNFINFFCLKSNIQLVNLFSKPDCKIVFDEVPGRHRHKLIDRDDHSARYPTFFNGEDITGYIDLKLNSKSLRHKGIKAELHGIIERYGTIKKTKEFLNLKTDVCRPEEITREKSTLNFGFKNVKMPYESYKGDYATVKYYVKIIITATYKNAEYEQEFAVVNPYDSSILQNNDEPIRMQVGMKDKLSLSIYFQHKNYNCRGTLKGFIIFNFLKINLKFMEVQIVRREVVFGDKNCEPAYVARYELIDGIPTNNVRIPIRFFLKSYNLTPTYPNVENIFGVKYFLNLVIADDQDNRYFKQKEICLFRLYKERRNYYNNNYNNNYNDNGYYNDEIFITEPIYEEDFSIYYKQGPMNNNQQDYYNDNDDYDQYNINPNFPSINEDESYDFGYNNPYNNNNIKNNNFNRNNRNNTISNTNNRRNNINDNFDIRNNRGNNDNYNKNNNRNSDYNRRNNNNYNYNNRNNDYNRRNNYNDDNYNNYDNKNNRGNNIINDNYNQNNNINNDYNRINNNNDDNYDNFDNRGNNRNNDNYNQNNNRNNRGNNLNNDNYNNRNNDYNRNNTYTNTNKRNNNNLFEDDFNDNNFDNNKNNINNYNNNNNRNNRSNRSNNRNYFDDEEGNDYKNQNNRQNNNNQIRNNNNNNYNDNNYDNNNNDYNNDRGGNRLITNNNPSSYHSIKSNNNDKQYNSNLFEDDLNNDNYINDYNDRPQMGKTTLTNNSMQKRFNNDEDYKDIFN